MQVQVKSSNGITLAPIESVLLSDRKIFIEGEIDSEQACEFVKQVLVLNKVNPEKPINVLINSQGGEIKAGMLMYDVIQSSKAPIRVFCLGKAYSMAAILFASGNHGRYILPNGELMIHEPLLGSTVSGNSSSIKSISDTLIDKKNQMNRILAKHTGKPLEVVEEATSFDHYFDADESVEFGLCDRIMSFGEMTEVTNER